MSIDLKNKLSMKIIREKLTLDELKEMAANTFGDLVKAVVDVDREILAIDAELHSDLEALLLENGSGQNSLWGINLYPEMRGNGFIEFDSIINMRPSQDNRSRGVEDAEIREKIAAIIEKIISHDISA
ncbi:MAG: DUF5674 family protein [Candidatus Omnitrophica bacterium]|nr:DUF5674 family protein [Candidatus Omnitrophota bacterium]